MPSTLSESMPQPPSNTSQDIDTLLDGFKSFPGFSAAAFDHLMEDTSADVALQVLARFARSLDEATATIDQGLKDDSSEKIWKACHKLAGTAELVGFKNFGDVSRKLSHVLQAAGELGERTAEVKAYLEDCRALSRRISECFPRATDYL